MSSALLPAGLVPFEDLFSTPPNPMLGPGSPPTGPAAERPDLEGSEPAEDPACSPPSPEGPGVPPCWDFGDLFGRPPNPMLSPREAPASPSPRAAPGASEGQLRPEAASLAGGPAGEVGPRKGGGGPRPDAKKSQGKPQDEDFAHLLEQYRRDRRAPSPAPAAPPAPKGVAKRGASTAGGRAKKRKRKGPARAPAPPAAQERPPVSQEFVHRNTVALGGQRVCKYFLAGRCLHGEQCRLDHRADGLKFQQLCKFYVQGYCTRAEHCRYLHHEFPCKFFHTGAKCYQGDHCGFSHAPLTPDTQSLLKAALAGPAAPPPDPAPASS